MVNRYGEQAYEDGYRVYTTITCKPAGGPAGGTHNVLDYDMRHVAGRGPASVLWKVGETPWETKKIVDSLKRQSGYGPLFPAVVTSANARRVVALKVGCRHLFR
ncbi:hypothetical protein MJ561_27040 [Klebsiella pneumoniae]|nr:hypothetical protein MJ561_27040 [Klebsiella pneumoniae]